MLSVAGYLSGTLLNLREKQSVCAFTLLGEEF